MSIAKQAKEVYETEFRAQQEAEQLDEFVAVGPVSKSYYLGDTFIDAALAAKQAHPNHKAFVIRIGHEAAFHEGAGGS